MSPDILNLSRERSVLKETFTCSTTKSEALAIAAVKALSEGQIPPGKMY